MIEKEELRRCEAGAEPPATTRYAAQFARNFCRLTQFHKACQLPPLVCTRSEWARQRARRRGLAANLFIGGLPVCTRSDMLAAALSHACRALR